MLFTSNLHALPLPSTATQYTLNQLLPFVRNEGEPGYFLIMRSATSDRPPIQFGADGSFGDDIYAQARAALTAKPPQPFFWPSDASWVQGVDRATLEALPGTFQLRKDPKHVDFLVEQGRVKAADRDNYEKVMLYFIVTLNGITYKLYLNDPWPSPYAAVATTGGLSESYMAGDIIEKYGLEATRAQ